jgi:hypothetical protein
VLLTAGWHRLRATTVNEEYEWAFTVRIVDDDGRPVPGIEVSADPPK